MSIHEETALYTLSEARLELARRACVTAGHGWEIIHQEGAEPIALICQRCGESRRVVQDQLTFANKST